MKNNRDFNYKRLQEARIIAGITITDLSDRTGQISKQALSQYETGKSTPPLEKVFLIAGILNFPVNFFYGVDSTDLRAGTTYFRSMASTSDRERMAQVYRTEYILRLYSILGKYVTFPTIKLPEEDYTNADPEETANALRSYWGIEGPILNIIPWLELNGIFVSTLSTGTEKIDAFSQIVHTKDKSLICVVLGNEKESAVRRQFCAAHEIGHLLLHQYVTDIDELKPSDFRKMEDEAHDFAGAFLLPAKEFSKDVLSYSMKIDTFVALKKKWHTSIGAMIIRCKKLGLIDQLEYTRLMKNYSARGWRTCEPFDDQIIMEKPIMAQKAIDLLIEKNVFTASELLDEFSKHGITLNPTFIEEILCLIKGTLAIRDDKKKADQKVEVYLRSDL